MIFCEAVENGVVRPADPLRSMKAMDHSEAAEQGTRAKVLDQLARQAERSWKERELGHVERPGFPELVIAQADVSTGVFGLECDHEAIRIGPWLAAKVAQLGDLQSNFLMDLATDCLLQGFPRLHESSQATEQSSLKLRPARQHAPRSVLHQRQDSGSDAGKCRELARWTAERESGPVNSVIAPQMPQCSLVRRQCTRCGAADNREASPRCQRGSGRLPDASRLAARAAVADPRLDRTPVNRPDDHGKTPVEAEPVEVAPAGQSHTGIVLGPHEEQRVIFECQNEGTSGSHLASVAEHRLFVSCHQCIGNPAAN